MLARPKIQRRRVDLIDNRRGKAGPSKVNALKVMLARVAGFNANMIEFRGMKISELRGSFFATVGAHYPPKFP